MVQKITDIETLGKLKIAFNKIFKSTNPFGQIFHDSIKEKMLIYNTDYSMIVNYGEKGKKELNLIEVFSKILQKKKGETVFLSMTETINLKNLTNSNHWIITLNTDPYNELNKFHEYVPFAEQAIYSSTGEWGMIVSHEDFLLLGGEENIIDQVSKDLMKLNYYEEKQLELFLSEWKEYYKNGNLDISWIPILLMNIYGEKKTNELLRKNSMIGLIEI